MVNLLKFKGKAEYEDGRDPTLSGMESYQFYSGPMGGIIIASGREIVFTGAITGFAAL